MVPVPSLFFIGENGIPLEIVGGNKSAIELASKIDNVLTKAGKNSIQSSLNLIDAEQKAASSSGDNNTITTSNINDVKSNANTDLISTEESATVDTLNDNKDITENVAKPTTSFNIEKQDNNESKKNVESKPESQNKELTAEVSKYYIKYVNICKIVKIISV